ncbi:unnamed protein product, partial [Closterium sp. NIES-54]
VLLPQPASAEPGGAEPASAEPGVAESEGAESGGAEPRGNASPGGSAGALSRLSHRREPLSPQQLREWFVQRTRLRSGAAGAGGPAIGGSGARGARDGDPGAGGPAAGGTGAGGAGATSPGGARVTAGAGGPGGAGAAGPGRARIRGSGAVGAGAGAGGAGGGGLGAGDLRAGGPGAGGTGAGGTKAGDPRAGGAGAGDPGAGGAGVGGAGAGSTGAGGTVQRRPFFVPPPPSSLPPPDLVLHQVLSLQSSTGLTPCSLGPPPHQSQPQLHTDSPLPALSPPASSLAYGLDTESDLVRAASPTVPCLLTTVVNDHSLESAAASALLAELVDFAATCRLDYAASLVAESDLTVLRLSGGDPDSPDIPTPRSYTEAITGPYSSQWKSAMDAEMASWKSASTYVDAVPPPGANIVDGMWIFRVKRPPGSPPVFKACYVARGFSQRQGVDFFHNFSPTLKMTTLRVLLHIAAQRDYELHSLDFSTAFLQAACMRISGCAAHLASLGCFLQVPSGASGGQFAPLSADPSLFLRSETSLPPFYILVYVDDLVFATADTEALAFVKSELQKRHTCT